MREGIGTSGVRDDDFPPAVLSLAGLGAPEYMQGIPFLGEHEGEPRSHVVGARDRVDEAYDLARAVRNERYLYIRHYMPHRSWNQPEYFSDQAPIRRAITRRAEEGTLDEAQLTYAGPTRPVEELFDRRRFGARLTTRRPRCASSPPVRWPS